MRFIIFAGSSAVIAASIIYLVDALNEIAKAIRESKGGIE